MNTRSAPARECVTGVVLAGGRGSRMGGVDKGLQLFAGRPLVQHALQRLAPQVATVAVNANRHLALYRSFGAPVWPDACSDFPGPLAGLLAALEAAPTPWVAAVPCDSPFLPADLVQRLAAAAESAGTAAAIAQTLHTDGPQPQPVFCLMHTRLAGPLGAFLAQGGRRMEAFTASVGHALADFDDAMAFSNANHWEDLQRLQALRPTMPAMNTASTPHESFEDFRRQALAAGFDEVLERRWPPDAVLATHTHDFSVSALVVQGQMWLGVDGAQRPLAPGDRFTLDALVPHDERYGPDGATVWVARRRGT